MTYECLIVLIQCLNRNFVLLHLLGYALINMTDAVMLTSVFGVVNPKQQLNDLFNLEYQNGKTKINHRINLDVFINSISPRLVND